MTTFDDLIPGDRFSAFGALWTKLDGSTARKHGDESISLRERGFGYRADSICTFERERPVIFKPVDA
jgi:hypothetical protein